MPLQPLLDRWYAFLPLLLCLGLLGRRHGWARAGAYVALGWAVTFAAEWASSTGPGLPFGRYLYRAVALRHDWRVAGVPLFDSVSFLWLAWCGLTLTGALGARGWWRWLTAALLMVGLDVGVDPVALRGRHWWLGQIYRYPQGGPWYGVPLSNYAGWALVALVLVALAAGCTRGPLRPGAPGDRWARGLAAALVAAVLGQDLVLGVRLGIAPSALVSLGAVLVALGLARAARPATDGPVAPELIVACALAREAAAIRRSGGWRAVRVPAGGPATWRRGAVALWVTGMGPAAARAAAAGCPAGAVVLVAGVAGACRQGWRTGEVALITAAVDESGAEIPLDQGLVSTLAAAGVGRPARVAAVAGPVDRRAERAAWAARGADLADLETAAWAGSGPGLRLAALRVVLDTPDRPLGAAGGLVPLGAAGPAPARVWRLLRSPQALAALWRVAGDARRAQLALGPAVAAAVAALVRPQPAAGDARPSAAGPRA